MKSPWLTIWTSPRDTIRKIVNTKPNRGFFILAMIYSLQSLLFFANYLSLGITYHFAVILILSIILSPVMGALWIIIFGWFFYLTGKLLKGSAPFSHTKAVFAWSKMPLFINLIMWIILLIVSAETTFIKQERGPILIFFNLVTIFSGIWQLIILIQGIREVQKFSLSRSIVNVLLGYLLGFVLFFVIIFFILSWIKQI